MTYTEYKRLIAAARKAAAEEDEARWMARLKVLGAVEPQGFARCSATSAARTASRGDRMPPKCSTA
jgi:hypothetical protein